MNVSRIPIFNPSQADSMLHWFAEMAQKDLLFHPEERACDIVRIKDGSPLFSDAECLEVDSILAQMFDRHGDNVIEACYPIFMRKAGFLSALDA